MMMMMMTYVISAALFKPVLYTIYLLSYDACFLICPPVIAANLLATYPRPKTPKSSPNPIMITIFVWLALITRLMFNLVMRIINLNSPPGRNQ